MISERVPAALAGERVDRVVALLADVSRSAAVAVIDPGGVPWVDVSMNKDLHACTYILID